MEINEENRILQLLREIPSEGDSINNNFDSEEEDIVEESEHNSDSDQSAEDNVVQLQVECQIPQPLEHQIRLSLEHQRTPHILGKDNTTVWYTHHKRQNVRAPRQNIITPLPCVRGIATNAKTPIQSWELYFTNDMLELQ